MAVSNEDREAAARSQSDALDAIVLGVDWAGLVFPPEGRDSVLRPRDAARQALDALVSHGWGPRPKVNGAALDHIADGYAEDGIHINLADLPAVLRECGVEVVRDGTE
jgi:hypothetical protein